jgi:hypothetical protein
MYGFVHYTEAKAYVKNRNVLALSSLNGKGGGGARLNMLAHNMRPAYRMKAARSTLAIKPCMDSMRNAKTD